jgi:hypothetical protein
LGRQSGVLNDSAHRERINWIVSGDGHDPPTVGHDDVLTLPRNPKPGPLECPNGSEVIDTGYARHSLGDLDLPNVGMLKELIANCQIFPDGVSGVLNGLGFRGAL